MMSYITAGILERRIAETKADKRTATKFSLGLIVVSGSAVLETVLTSPNTVNVGIAAGSFVFGLAAGGRAFIDGGLIAEDQQRLDHKQS